MYSTFRAQILAHFKPLGATLSDHQKDLLAEALWQLGLEGLPARASERKAEAGSTKIGFELTLFQYSAGIRSAALAISRGLIQKQLTEEKTGRTVHMPFGEEGPR